MPLIRHGAIPLDQQWDDRKVEFRSNLLNKDLIRHYRTGRDVSFRVGRSKLGSAPVIEALRSLAEDDVYVGDEIIELNERAYTNLACELTNIFEKTLGVGFAPSKPNHKFSVIGGDANLNPVNVAFTEDWAFYPVAASLMSYELVITFRAWQHKNFPSHQVNVVNKHNSAVIAIALSDLGDYSPELKSYVQKLVAHANNNEHVKNAFEQLHRMLRPKEARKKALEEANKRYEKIENFGTWG